jgi:hypothetical protein
MRLSNEKFPVPFIGVDSVIETRRVDDRQSQFDTLLFNFHVFLLDFHGLVNSLCNRHSTILLNNQLQTSTPLLRHIASEFAKLHVMSLGLHLRNLQNKTWELTKSV